jgi:hypothetical protein
VSCREDKRAVEVEETTWQSLGLEPLRENTFKRDCTFREELISNPRNTKTKELIIPEEEKELHPRTKADSCMAQTSAGILEVQKIWSYSYMEKKKLPM